MADNTDIQVEMIGAADELPLRMRSSSGRTGLVVSSIQAGLVLLVALLIWLGAIPLGGSLVAIAVAVLGVILLARGVLGKGGSREFRIDGQTVQQTGGPGGTWSEPISAYRGVRWRREYLDLRGNMKKVRQRHLIDLVHDDPARTVPLYSSISGRANLKDTVSLLASASRSDERQTADKGRRLARQASGADVRDVWERLANLIGVPAIDARGEAEEVRQTESLDKSVGERAAEDHDSIARQDTPAPPSLKVTRVDGSGDTGILKVEILASTLPKFITPLFMGLGALMVIFGILGGGVGLVILGLVLGAAPFGISRLHMNNPRVLTITRQELRHENPTSRRSGNFNLPLSAIESVHIEQRNDVEAIGRAGNFVGKEIVVSTDDLEHRIGAGLDDQALNWLRDHIRSALATT
ncbi:hypothetical protein HKCCE3408_01390 [Rhodobacterales bacterium HKCCE3408]|nr:hypothetical protein [Rhodobacterales bacterium HKCCE3408]